MVAVNAICADTDERAERLARPGWLAFLRLRMGRPIALPSVEDAAAYEFNEMELEFVAQRRVGQALGSPETVRAQLTSLIERTGADELMLTNQVYDIKDRLRSYELIAGLADRRAYGLTPDAMSRQVWTLAPLRRAAGSRSCADRAVLTA